MQNRTEKQIMPFKTAVNWLFNDIWCYLAIGCFEWKICIFQQTVQRGLLYPETIGGKLKLFWVYTIIIICSIVFLAGQSSFEGYSQFTVVLFYFNCKCEK